MRIYRAIVWTEDVIPNTDPRDKNKLPFVIIRSRETFFIQTSDQSKAVKAFKADIGKLANAKP
jgi:protoporphyrinogen oxidase